ncbi:transposase [Salmonella enterica]|nr:transposase [Salmonella enterica]ECO1003631.1 transposase [Salmonella enterica subsp. enterica serovar Give]EDR1013851.1 transposase [Salmonella enterica subsp. enterica serovar Glostrup]EAU7078582.1 transposase [Salmonella enterica]EAW8076512.1 transposase [Salmonella enterica]
MEWLHYKTVVKGNRKRCSPGKLDQWFVSAKTCHCCGYRMMEILLHKSISRCPDCDKEHECDINAALNIGQKGIVELKAA